MIETKESELQYWNDQYFGIFQTIHDMDGRGRRIDNCVEITCWPFDIDDGSKEEQLNWITSRSILPSVVVETRRGFQGRYEAVNASKENFKLIAGAVCTALRADPSSRDFTRVHRVPGFWHCKYPKDKFMVREISRNCGRYTEEQMLRYFPLPEVKQERPTREMRVIEGDSFWGKVFSLDCEWALGQLSGHAAVNGEVYDFIPVANGNLNILVNGVGTGCWIDKEKKIGSHSNGGPSIAKWLAWFGHSWGQTAQIIKEVFEIS